MQVKQKRRDDDLQQCTRNYVNRIKVVRGVKKGEATSLQL